MAAKWHVKRNAYRVLVGKPQGNRPLGKLRHGWEHNIKIEIKDIGLRWGV
jgi:hypothetical protein